MIKVIELRPVVVDNQVQLWDIWVDGVWLGSRRTLVQVARKLGG